MHTVFVEVKLTTGYTVTVNPAQITSIEPLQDEPDTKCVVRTNTIGTTQDPATGAIQVIPIVYVVEEPREALQSRIAKTQQAAQQGWWDHMTSKSEAEGSEAP